MFAVLVQFSTPSFMFPAIHAFFYIALHFPLALASVYTVILRCFRYIPHSIFRVEVYEDFVVMGFVRQTPIGTK